MSGTIAKNVELNKVMQESLQTINKIQDINELEKRKDQNKKPKLLLRRDVEGKEKKATYLLNNIIEEKPLYEAEANKLKLGKKHLEKKHKEKMNLPKKTNKIFFTNIGKNTNVSVFKPKEEIEKEKIEKEKIDKEREEQERIEKEKKKNFLNKLCNEEELISKRLLGYYNEFSDQIEYFKKFLFYVKDYVNALEHGAKMFEEFRERYKAKDEEIEEMKKDAKFFKKEAALVLNKYADEVTKYKSELENFNEKIIKFSKILALYKKNLNPIFFNSINELNSELSKKPKELEKKFVYISGHGYIEAKPIIELGEKYMKKWKYTIIPLNNNLSGVVFNADLPSLGGEKRFSEKILEVLKILKISK